MKYTLQRSLLFPNKCFCFLNSVQVVIYCTYCIIIYHISLHCLLLTALLLPYLFSLSGFNASFDCSWWLPLCCKCMQCGCEGVFLFCSACVEFIRQPTWIRVHLSASPVITASAINVAQPLHAPSRPGLVASHSGQRTCGGCYDTWTCLSFFLLAQEGLEPGTFSVRGRCSTNCQLSRPMADHRSLPR